MKDKELLKELNKKNYNLEIYNYLKQLINLSISPFHNIETLKKIKLEKLEYEIIKYNLISKSIKSIHNIDNIKISKKNNFNIKYNDLDILTIQFLNNIDINIYDRSNIEIIYNSIKLEITLLENSLDNYYFDINTIKKINYLKYKLDELEKIRCNKEVLKCDKLISEELEIPRFKGILIAQNEIYNTSEIFSNRKVLIYKDYLYK